MSVKSQQSQRLQWLEQQNQQKLQAKQKAMEQAATAGQQYRPEKEKPITSQVLNNGGKTTQKKQQHLSDLYQKVYNIANTRQNLLQDEGGVNTVLKDLGYNTMSNEEKEIVNYFIH